MNEIKNFLRENLIESIAVTAKIFKIKYIILTKLIARDKETIIVAKREEHNRILNEQQEQIIQRFIRSLITHEILLTHDIVYEAIISMRRAYNCDAFFKEWFRKWYKRSNLHMIKFKSLTMKRYEVATKMQIKNWFADYTRIMHEMKIRSENLINFDETKFRVECMRRQKVMILIEMKELYAMSLENRRFCTIIEMINETNDFSSSSMIIMQDMKFHLSNFTPPQISSLLKFHP